MSQTKKISHVYNPDNQTRQELLDNFVVRLPVFEKLFRAVKDSRMDTGEQHFLIQGQRGAGKTSLLLKLAYEIESAPVLADWLIPVRLNEEQYNIFSLCRLWESVAEQLTDHPGFEDLADIFEKSFEEKDYPEHCYRILEKRLQRENKKLVLLIDNIVDVLKKIGEKECRQLRDILHTTTEIRIIAASAKTLEQSFHYDKPFYEFFKTIYLEGLSREETETLLLKLAENYQKPQVREIIEKYPNRLETLRRLTGGIPRTIILLFEIFVDDSANVFEDLELILDRITPLYKHRMDDLSGQQQAIMDAIAMNWDAIATKDIARKVRLESKAVAAQLKLLEKSNLIHATQADKKNKLYLITERFFNIWYLMRYGRKKSREQVRFLVRFLEDWCSPEELAERIKKHISLAQDNALHSKGAYYMCEALAQCAPSTGLQHELILSTREYLSKANPELAEGLLVSDLEIVDQAFSLAGKKNDLVSALRKLGEVRRQDEKVWNAYGLFYLRFANDPKKAESYFRMAVEKGDTSAMYNLANLLWEERKDVDAAEKYYRMAAEKGEVFSMNNLANLLWEERKDVDAAEKYYRMAVEKGEVFSMNNLANLLWEERKDVDAAEKYYRMAAEKGDASAMNSLANFLRKERKDLSAAEKYYRMAAEKGDTSAMGNLADFLWEERKDLDAAEKYYRMATKRGHASAMCDLANFLRKERKDLGAAEKYYRMAVEKGEVFSMNNLATLLWEERKDVDAAEKYYRMAVEKGEMLAMYNLANLLWKERKDLDAAEKYYHMAAEKGHVSAMNSLANLLRKERKDVDAAEKYYRMAAEKGHASAMNNLANLLWKERNDFEVAEKYYRLAAEKGHAIAMNSFANLLRKERKDLDTAEKYYRMAAENGHAYAMYNLANLLWDERNDLDEAEKYYRMAVKKGHAGAMNGLAWFYFLNIKAKAEALKLAGQSVKLSKNVHNTHTLAVCALWHDRYDESLKAFRQFLEFRSFDLFESDITFYLVFLLAKKQHHLLLELFKDERYRLRERFKPVYYALMQRMRGEYPKEYKKMGEELRQTVEEILAEADKLARNYA